MGTWELGVERGVERLWSTKSTTKRERSKEDLEPPNSGSRKALEPIQILVWWVFSIEKIFFNPLDSITTSLHFIAYLLRSRAAGRGHWAVNLPLEPPHPCWLTPLVFSSSHNRISSLSPVFFFHKGFPRKSWCSLFWFGIFLLYMLIKSPSC